MTVPPDGQSVQIRAGTAQNPIVSAEITSDTPTGRESQPIQLLDEDVDPLTCS